MSYDDYMNAEYPAVDANFFGPGERKSDPKKLQSGQMINHLKQIRNKINDNT